MPLRERHDGLPAPLRAARRRGCPTPNVSAISRVAAASPSTRCTPTGRARCETLTGHEKSVRIARRAGRPPAQCRRPSRRRDSDGRTVREQPDDGGRKACPGLRRLHPARQPSTARQIALRTADARPAFHRLDHRWRVICYNAGLPRTPQCPSPGVPPRHSPLRPFSHHDGEGTEVVDHDAVVSCARHGAASNGMDRVS